MYQLTNVELHDVLIVVKHVITYCLIVFVIIVE